MSCVQIKIINHPAGCSVLFYRCTVYFGEGQKTKKKMRKSDIYPITTLQIYFVLLLKRIQQTKSVRRKDSIDNSSPRRAFYEVRSRAVGEGADSGFFDKGTVQT